MFRPEIKVLDCTVRDGGLMNNWQFSDDFVCAVFKACAAAGVDYMEIGYKSSEQSYSRDENGPWKFCADDDLKRVCDISETDMKLAAMADIGRIEHDDILPKSECALSMIRVACYVNQVDKAIDLAHRCMEKGYETTVNLMAVSKVIERDLDEALGDLAKSDIPVIYLVDSFGAMYSEQVQYLARKYLWALEGKQVGFHAHNNQQLAFANTIEAIICGCNRLDATIFGIGRGAGNCPLELLLAFLKNPKFKLGPILDAIQAHLLPLSKEIEWGYFIPYVITGILNEHPRSALKIMETDKRDDFREFYDRMVDGTPLE
ncbi:MAG: aldolase catalytic domain-containing protein [Armatimonadota bacterium]|nr:aldolase catalytic domain-containing protein [Armatimonadota bacterium]